ncbi:AbrB/MazE/SpoVT family DNA-binding domain-containing protein [Candidatus Woesearchaeota archaeon]|nr:AbrB/MazE/SpoVT family DNA-binding domain-containing protein [Candidatus Woesearchaeota archaeon]
MIIKLKLGDKGQLVIPKVVRDSIGLSPSKHAILEVKNKKIEIRPLTEQDVVKAAEDRAKRAGADVSRWVYGDRIYEEEFE